MKRLSKVTLENAYTFGFNGQERKDDYKGKGNHNHALYWEYDTRLGKRGNPDPVVNHSESPYATFNNSPIAKSDVLGNDPNSYEVDSRTGAFRLIDFTGGDKTDYLTFTNNSIKYHRSDGSIGRVEVGNWTISLPVNFHVINGYTGENIRIPGHSYHGQPWTGTTTPYNDPITLMGPGLIKYGVEKSLAIGAGEALSTSVTRTVLADAMPVVESRLVRVIPEKAAVGATKLGQLGDAEVFVANASEIEGLSAEGIAQKLTLVNKDGSFVRGPFRVMEFDASSVGKIRIPQGMKNPGFIEGGKNYGRSQRVFNRKSGFK